MLMALTATPSTFVRVGSFAAATVLDGGTIRHRCLSGTSQREFVRDLRLDPGIRACEPLFQADLWLPAEDIAQTRIIGVAATHSHWAGHVLLDDAYAGNVGDEICELVNRDEAILTEVEWLCTIRPHQPINALEAIIDIAERTRLLTIPPDLHLALTTELRSGDLAAEGSGCFLATALPRA